MHLHLWSNEHRRNGLGPHLVKQSIPLFFEQFELQDLYCQTYSKNLAPNKTLERVGFEFVSIEPKTIPGWINFEQDVNLWHMSRDRYNRLYKNKNEDNNKEDNDNNNNDNDDEP